MSRIRGPYVRFCERDEAVTPHPTQYIGNDKITLRSSQCLGMNILGYGHRRRCLHGSRLASI